MTERQRMLANAQDLLIDAKEVRELIALEQPHRLATAQLMFDDTFRVFQLLESSGHLTARKRMEIASKLIRATLLSDALKRPLQ